MSQPSRRPAVLLLLAALVSTLLLAGLGGAPARAAAPAPGGSCGCAEEGGYETTGGLESPYIGGDGSSAPGDPTYRISATGTGPSVTLVVRRVATGATVATITTSHTNWGFSPDERKLVTWRVAAPNLELSLYDLGGSRPGAAVLNRSTGTGDGTISFSADGRWLALTHLVSGTTNQGGILVADAASGAIAYTATYTFTAQHGGGPYGTAGWGFSPDGSKFFHAWTNGSSAQVRLVDLAQKRATWTGTFSGTGFWRFSPCGSKLGMVQQGSTGQIQISLVDAVSGKVDATRTHRAADVAFEARATAHVAVVEGEVLELAANVAPECPDEEAPTWPSTATLAADGIGRRALTLTWTAAADDRAVAGYRVYRGTTLLDTVAATTRTLRVTGLQPDTRHSFRVEAGDAAGHWTTTGPTVEARTLRPVPTWPAGWLVADDVALTSTTLRWAEAPDEDGVTGYVVSLDGEPVATVDGSTRTHRLTGLAPGRTYDVAVQARNAAGFTTDDGPTATLTTDDFTALDRPDVSGTVYEDVDGNGRRDAGESGVVVTEGAQFNISVHRVDGAAPGRDLGDYVDEQAGEYLVSDLPDGVYLVSLGGFGQGKPGYAMTQPTDQQPQLVEIVDGHGWGEVDFGVTPGQLPRIGTARIEGSVYLDTDGDGVRDAGERAYTEPVRIGCDARPNVESCALSILTRTDGEGRYVLDGLVPGQYQAGPWALPEGWWYSTAGRQAPIVLGERESVRLEHGIVQGTTTVRGLVFRDDDADGVRDAGEPVRAGGTEVCLSVYGQRRCDFAGDDGRWTLEGVPVGRHRMTVSSLSAGWAVTTGTSATVAVTAGGVDVAAPVGLDGPDALLEGVVFDDRDGDGVRDAGEPVRPSRDLCVTRDGDEPYCFRTGADGAFVLRWLPAGRYTVSLPDGAAVTGPTSVTFGEDGAARLDVGLGAAVVTPARATAPRGVRAATAARPQLTVAWTAPARTYGEPVTDYIVQVAAAPGQWRTVKDGRSTRSRVVVGGLRPHRRYLVRIAAVTDAGRGAWSAPFAARTRR